MSGTYTIDATTYRTTNYDQDGDGNAVLMAPAGILLHDSTATRSSDIPWLCGRGGSQVSCNYYVQRDGVIYQFAPDTYRTWHAGSPDVGVTTWWGSSAASYGIRDGNRLIGIELEHLQGQDYPDPQLGALAFLCHDLINRYGFPYTRVGLHRWYAPSRKSDPNNWGDVWVKRWIMALFDEHYTGEWYAVMHPRGANVRELASTASVILETLAPGAVFLSSGPVAGEAVNGNSQWLPVTAHVDHSAGRGFVWSGICQVTKEAT